MERWELDRKGMRVTDENGLTVCRFAGPNTTAQDGPMVAISPELVEELASLLEDLERIGFVDDETPVSGADCVDVVCQHIGSIRRLAKLAKGG